MKRFKKFFCSCTALALILSYAAVPAFAYEFNGIKHKEVTSSVLRNNHGDTHYWVDAIDNSGGTPYYTDLRRKEDASSSYVRSASSNTGNLHCWVIRSHSDEISGDPTDRYYGHDTYDGASKNQVTIAPGQRKKLINYVKEDGYSYAGIGFIMQVEGVRYDFYWSPDSI